MRIRFAITLASVAVCLFASTSFAQDNNRWVNQFGTRSALMGGAVVGGVNDSSAVFYNPGALGFVRDASVSVSANVARYEKYERDNAITDGVGYDSSNVDVVPSEVSGIHIFEGLPEVVFGFSVLTMQSTRFNDTERREGFGDLVVLPNFEGNEDFIGQASEDADLDEYWFGLSGAYAIDENISLGLTNFLGLRQQTRSTRDSVRSINENTLDVSSVERTSYMDFYNLRLLWKVGAAFDYDTVKFGVTITTPSVDLGGDATSARSLAVNDFDYFDDGSVTDLVADDRQEDLDAEYRSPMSVASGIEIKVLDATTLAASVEWFGGVGQYDVVKPDSRDFLRPVGVFTGLFDSRDFLGVTDAADSVVNWAIALEQQIDEEFSVFGAFRSDYETAQPIVTDGSALGITAIDLWHITTGLTYTGDRSTFGFGLEYTFGDGDRVNIDNATIEDTDYTAWNVIFGYSYHFDDIVPLS